MIFCKQLLFLHVPKTGGMSVTHYLLDVLPRPVYYTRPRHQRRRPVPSGVVDLDGRRHATLAEAQEVLPHYGFELSDFPAIVATLRNPYDLEVSRYTHYHRPYVVGRGSRSWEIAMNEDFTTFARESRPHRGKTLEHYFLLGRTMPENMTVLRFERLANDMRAVLARVGIRAKGDLPRENVSRHDHFASYYTREAEEAVYEKYRWVFDEGFYDRMAVGQDARQPQYGQKLAVEGPISQVGPCHGLRPDLWVGERLAFRVKVEEAVRRMTVQGKVPPTSEPPISFSAIVNGRSTETSLHHGDFTWDVPCELQKGARPDIEIVARSTSPPSASGPDPRGRLTFKLRRIIFYR